MRFPAAWLRHFRNPVFPVPSKNVLPFAGVITKFPTENICKAPDDLGVLATLSIFPFLLSRLLSLAPFPRRFPVLEVEE